MIRFGDVENKIDRQQIHVVECLSYPNFVYINLSVDITVSCDEIVIATYSVTLLMKNTIVCVIDRNCFTDDGLDELKRLDNVMELP